MLRLLFLVIFSFCAWGQQQCGRKPTQPPWPVGYTEDGKIQGKIVGGRNSAPDHYWPWQLSLQFLRAGTTDQWGHTCGASLIASNWALTAAHCVEERMIGLNDSRREDPENFRLVIGTISIADTRDSQIIGINLIVKHERWAPNPYLGYPNDIALLRLKSNVDLTDPKVELACIPKDTNFDVVGEQCWITGWGKMNFRDEYIPAILQEALIDSISNEVCGDLNFGYIRDSHICAGTGFPNACSGDSGGPMSCYKDGQWWQVGLTSWGSSTCNTIPGVYTRLSSFWEWIHIMMAMNSITQPMD